MVGVGAARGADPVGALPHLQIRLGAVPHVPRQTAPADAAEVVEPVGIQPVVGDAFLAVVERPLPGPLTAQGDLPVVATERVAEALAGRARSGWCDSPPRSAP